VAFFETACSGGVVLINKRLLTCLDPVATNMLVRAVSVATIIVATAPLTLLHLWSLTYNMTWSAAGYVTILAVVGWLIGQNLYYFALRSGRVSVVIPITSTDLLFTALFATVLIAGALGRLTLVGLFLAVAGVVLIARTERSDAAARDGLPDAAEPQTPSLAKVPEAPGWARSVPIVVLLSVASAAGWGLAPVLIQLAERSVGGATVTMIVQAQGLGLLMIAVVVLIRRIPLTTRTLTRIERRRARRLVTITGMLEGSCAVIYYVVIQHLGSVLTALIAATTPIFAIVWSALFLRERLGRRLAFGVAITLTGVLLATIDRLH
jgi:drug/metabolite transporter (DMT)-like permease